MDFRYDICEGELLDLGFDLGSGFVGQGGLTKVRLAVPPADIQSGRSLRHDSAEDFCVNRAIFLPQSLGGSAARLAVSPPTYHRWKQKYRGAKEDTVKRLKAVEKENGQLKKLVADPSFDKAVPEELVEGTDRREIDGAAA